MECISQATRTVVKPRKHRSFRATCPKHQQLRRSMRHKHSAPAPSYRAGHLVCMCHIYKLPEELHTSTPRGTLLNHTTRAIVCTPHQETPSPQPQQPCAPPHLCAHLQTRHNTSTHTHMQIRQARHKACMDPGTQKVRFCTPGGRRVKLTPCTCVPIIR
jgi:hypothetical protein